MAHPRFAISKEYVITSKERLTEKQLRALAAGCTIEDVKVLPLEVAMLGRDSGDAKRDFKVKVVVGEGKKHEVRLLAKAAGIPLVALKRARIGKLRLPSELGLGGFRELSRREAMAIFK